MAYKRYRTQWKDGRSGGTPINAEFLTTVENGLVDHETRITAVETTGGSGTVNPAAVDAAVQAAIPTSIANYFVTNPIPAVGAGSITTTNLAADSVTSAKILDGSVTTSEIADSAVTAAKIVDGVLTPAKLTTAAQARLLPATGGTTGQALVKQSDGTASWGTVTASVAPASVGVSSLATDAVSRLVPTGGQSGYAVVKQPDGSVAWAPGPTATITDGSIDTTQLATSLKARLPIGPTTGSGKTQIYGYDRTGAQTTKSLSEVMTPGYVNVLEYGCDGSGVEGTNNATKAAANDAGFAAARTDALSRGLGVWIPVGVYDTTTTVNMYGVNVRGEDSRRTIIQQNTSGTACTPVIIVGGANRRAERFYVRHYALPDVNLDESYGCGVFIQEAGPVFTLDEVYSLYSGWGFYCGNKAPGNTTARNFMFSATISNIRAGFCNKGGGYFSAKNAGNTGNVYSNLYFSNGGGPVDQNNDGVFTVAEWLTYNPGTTATVASWYFGNSTGLSINVINSEWFQGPNCIVFAGVNDATVTNHHIEGWVPTGFASVYQMTADSNNREFNLGFQVQRWLIDSSKATDVTLCTMNRPTVVRWGSRPVAPPETVNGLVPIREHKFLTGSNGSSVVRAGGLTGAAPPSLTTDTIASGVSVNVVDVLSLSSSGGISDLPAPTNLAVTTTGGNSTLTWNAVQGALSYEVQRKPFGGTYVPIGKCDVTNYVDVGVGSTPDYVYRVAASPLPIGNTSTEVRSNGLPNDGTATWVPNYSAGVLSTVGAGDFTVINPTYTTTGSEAEPPGATVIAGSVLRVASGATAGTSSGADNLFIRSTKSGWTSWKEWQWEADVTAEAGRPALLVLNFANITVGNASYVRFKLNSNAAEVAYKTTSGANTVLSSAQTVNPGIDATWKRVVVSVKVQTDGSLLCTYSLAGTTWISATIPAVTAGDIPAGAFQITVGDQGSTATPYAMSIRDSSANLGMFKLTHGAV